MKTRLKWWGKVLAVQFLSDLTLAKVETTFASLAGAPKTKINYIQSLGAFLKWCKDHQYVREVFTTKVTRPEGGNIEEWRALTVDEARKLIQAAPQRRKLLYEVALLTGLRVGEIRALTVGNVDVINSCLRTNITKNKKMAVQPLPAELARKLAEVANGKMPSERLLRLPCHPDRRFTTDAEHAGIQIVTPEGRAVFHSLRKCYITALQECAGATLVEAQKLARHSTPMLTANVYTRPAQTRLGSLVEILGKLLA
jgi:integrase